MKLIFVLLIPIVFFMLIVVAMLYELMAAVNEAIRAIFGL